MESMAPVLDKMKMYLTTLYYPNIDICAADDVVQIFALQNRKKLLMWSLNQLSDDLAIPLEEEEQTLYMANIIYEWGFCKSSDKTAFVKCELDIKEQFVIFSRLFWFLIYKEPRPITSNELNFEDIEKNVLYSTDLKKKIPKTVSMQSYESDKTGIVNEIKLQQDKLDSLVKLEEFNLPNWKDLNIDGFQDDLSTFVTNSSIILGSTSAVTADADNTLQLSSSNILNEMDVTLENTIKHLLNIKTVSDHKNIPSSKKSLNEDCEVLKKMSEKIEIMLLKCPLEKNTKN